MLRCIKESEDAARPTAAASNAAIARVAVRQRGWPAIRTRTAPLPPECGRGSQ
jgi:hypothetical protein